jgi:hypothetical protein
MSQEVSGVAACASDAAHPLRAHAVIIGNPLGITSR